MNPSLEQFIYPIIELHKKSIGNRYDWSAAHKEVAGLSKSDRDALKEGMVEMGIVEYNSYSDRSRTLLKKFDFDLEEHKRKEIRDESKKDFDFKLVKKTLEDYPKVQKRAEDAITISRSALLIAGLAALLTLIKWICSGQ